MIRNLVLAAAGATALMAGPAYAGVNSDSPPMPYTAPDPVYTPHKVVSTVDMSQPKDEAVLTNSGSASDQAAPASR